MAELTVVNNDPYSTHAIESLRVENGNTPSLPFRTGLRYHGNEVSPGHWREMALGLLRYNTEWLMAEW